MTNIQATAWGFRQGGRGEGLKEGDKQNINRRGKDGT